MSMDYTNTSQQTLLGVLEALAARPFDGETLARLVDRVAASRDQCFRAAKNLELAGWAEQAPGGAWRLTPRAAQLSERVRLAIADLHRSYLE